MTKKYDARTEFGRKWFQRKSALMYACTQAAQEGAERKVSPRNNSQLRILQDWLVEMEAERKMDEMREDDNK